MTKSKQDVFLDVTNTHHAKSMDLNFHVECVYVWVRSMLLPWKINNKCADVPFIIIRDWLSRSLCESFPYQTKWCVRRTHQNQYVPSIFTDVSLATEKRQKRAFTAYARTFMSKRCTLRARKSTERKCEKRELSGRTRKRRRVKQEASCEKESRFSGEKWK